MVKIRVFLLDNHEIVRRGLRSLLEAEPDMEVVGEAATAEDGIAALLEHRPDVVLLDAWLPHGSGVEVARHLSAHAPEVLVLMVSSHVDDDALTSAFEAGVRGYVPEDIDGDALVQGVRTVAAGQTLIAPVVAGRMMHRIREQSEAPGGYDNLSAQERKILDLMGEGLTNRQIGERLFLSEKTIKNNVTRGLPLVLLTLGVCSSQAASAAA